MELADRLPTISAREEVLATGNGNSLFVSSIHRARCSTSSRDCSKVYGSTAFIDEKGLSFGNGISSLSPVEEAIKGLENVATLHEGSFI